MKKIKIALVGVAMLSLTACSLPPPSAFIAQSGEGASGDCLNAAEAAVKAEEALYDTHPLYSADIPSIDAPETEWKAYEALMADEEEQWLAAHRPVYEECDGPEQWLVAASQFPLIAGVTEADFVDTMALELWCEVSPDDAACSGLDAWLEANGSALG